MNVKSYVVYLVIVAPFIALDYWLVHPKGVRTVIMGVIVFAGLHFRGRVQKKIWP